MSFSPARQLARWAGRLRQGATLALLALALPSAHAVPAFARQTGQGCIACHVGGFGPQLTPFGRAFKLGAYTLQGGEGAKETPVSAMLVASYTHTAQSFNAQNPPPTGFGNNDNFTALQQASLFFAGRLSDHLGVMAQATYSDPGSQSLAWDNTDLRYANDVQLGSTPALLGISMNNNPTLSDVWNTTPAWQFSYMAPPFGQNGPPVSPLIYGLGQSVVGVSGYALLDNSWYAEAGAYHNLSNYWARTLNAGNATLQDEAPYWRVWYSTTVNSNVIQVGLLGLDARLNNGAPGPTDHYRDIGADATYQFLDGGPNLVTANFIYMHESQSLDQTFANGNSANPTNSLNNATINVSYWYQNTYGATLGLFNSSGSSDATLYGGSATGSPNTNGAVIELDWNPFGKDWANPEKNLRLGLQYTMYDKYLGATHNFDGAGTDASAMNTMYVYLWTAI